MIATAALLAASQILLLDCTTTWDGDDPQRVGSLGMRLVMEGSQVVEVDLYNPIDGLDVMRPKYRWKGKSAGDTIVLTAIERKRGMVDSVEVSLSKQGEGKYNLTWQRIEVFGGGGPGDATVFEYPGKGACTVRDSKAGQSQ